jgi:hypothetical protein
MGGWTSLTGRKDPTRVLTGARVLSDAKARAKDVYGAPAETSRAEPKLRQSLVDGLVEFADPIFTFEDLAGFGAVGGADDAVFLHDVD